MEDEPIRQLTREEFDLLRADIRKSHEAKAQSKGARESPQQEKAAEREPPPETDRKSIRHAPESSPAATEQIMETGSRIWELRKRGYSVYEVSRKLGIPMASIHEILGQFEGAFYSAVANDLQHRANLEDARCEALLKTWLPIATGGPVPREKATRNGEVYIELDADLPIRASQIVLGAIATRVKIMQASRSPESANGKDTQTNILVWLSQVLPGVSRIVQQVGGDSASQGRQVLELEFEDIDSNGSHGS